MTDCPQRSQRAGVHYGLGARFRLDVRRPKSVSLLRALTDDIGDQAMVMAHQKGIDAAMAFLHEHAGYTWVHNPLTGNKNLQRLPHNLEVVVNVLKVQPTPAAKPGPSMSFCDDGVRAKSLSGRPDALATLP
jgi:hypothetical protein